MNNITLAVVFMSIVCEKQELQFWKPEPCPHSIRCSPCKKCLCFILLSTCLCLCAKLAFLTLCSTGVRSVICRSHVACSFLRPSSERAIARLLAHRPLRALERERLHFNIQGGSCLLNFHTYFTFPSFVSHQAGVLQVGTERRRSNLTQNSSRM